MSGLTKLGVVLAIAGNLLVWVGLIINPYAFLLIDFVAYFIVLVSWILLTLGMIKERSCNGK